MARADGVWDRQARGSSRLKIAEKPTASAYLGPNHVLVVSLNAAGLSADEKSQIQVLDRRQPGLPLKKERCQR